MAGNTTDVQIASNALILLGHQPIASFTEPTAGAEVASNLYQSSYDSMLTTYRWRFATKKAQLARLSAAPINEWSYAYQLPTDLLYVINTQSSSNYEIYGDKLYTNAQTESIDYIYSVSPDKLPAYYVKALELFLAMQFAIPVTGDTDKATIYQRMYEKQMKVARYTDSTQRPQDSFVDSPYTDVRS